MAVFPGYPGSGVFPGPDVWPGFGPGGPPDVPITGERPLTELGRQMLDGLPVKLRGSSDYQAVIHAVSRELMLVEAAAEAVRDEFNPATSEFLLPAWEAETRLPVGGQGASVSQREAGVVAALRAVLGSGTGVEWEQRFRELTGAEPVYTEHVPGDSTTPPANTLRVTLPFPANGSAYDKALLNIREFTAAHLAVEFNEPDEGGFRLDESQLDLQDI